MYTIQLVVSPTHSEVNGNHEVDLAASTNVVSERMKRCCPGGCTRIHVNITIYMFNER